MYSRLSMVCDGVCDLRLKGIWQPGPLSFSKNKFQPLEMWNLPELRQCDRTRTAETGRTYLY